MPKSLYYTESVTYTGELPDSDTTGITAVLGLTEREVDLLMDRQARMATLERESLVCDPWDGEPIFKRVVRWDRKGGARVLFFTLDGERLEL